MLVLLVLKVKITLEQAMNVQRGSNCVAVLFISLGARWEWVVKATPRPLYPWESPGTYCIGDWVSPTAGLNECGKTSPLTPGIWSRDCLAHSQSLYPALYPKNLGATLIFWTPEGWHKTSFKLRIHNIRHPPRKYSGPGHLVPGICASRNQESWGKTFELLIEILSRYPQNINKNAKQSITTFLLNKNAIVTAVEILL